MVQLHAYFRTRVSCSFMHSVTMHYGVTVWR
jgi:hypothetical protein